MAEGGLGRIPPTDNRHAIRYPLTAGTMPAIPTPVVIGVNWYQAFDTPQQGANGARWFPTPRQPWGTIRGGHCVCLKPPILTDTQAWWEYYDQGSEGACVGFGTTRALVLLNRRMYDAWSVYRTAQRIDEWPGEDYDGTSVRAGMDVARDYGMWRIRRSVVSGPFPKDGISANRWAQSVDEIAACLDPASRGRYVLNAGYVTVLNSWGTNYPHYTRMPLDTLDRLIFREDGDATIITDR